MAERIFGEIPGIYEGFEFGNRLELNINAFGKAKSLCRDSKSLSLKAK